MVQENTFKSLMGHVMQIIYVVFLGIIIAVFCGLGIDTFYPAPKAPVYPVVLQDKTVPTTTQTNEQIAAQKTYDDAQTKFQNDIKVYNRNASLIAIALAILALALSLTVLIRWEVIANGVMLGGIFTLGYSLILGVQTEDTKFRFFLISVGVLVALGLGYMKFIKPQQEN